MSSTTTKDIIKYVLILIIIVAVFVMIWIAADKIVQHFEQPSRDISPSRLIDLTPYPTKDYQGDIKDTEKDIENQETKIEATDKEIEEIIQALQELEKELEIE